MALPPQPGCNGGYDLDQFLNIVSRMEGAGLLDDFTKSHPQYVVGIEVARAILQRGRNNNNAATRGIGPGPSPPQSCGLACMPSSGNSAPNVPSVRHFVGLISQLLEELCPNRYDPNIRSCEDRCLAALQMAVVHCLKLVRQKKLGEPQPVNNSLGGFQQSGPSPRAIGYQQFNPPTLGNTMNIPPQQGAGGPPPPQCNLARQQGGGGLPPQQVGGRFPPQQGGGFPPQQGGGFPPQQAGGFPPQQVGGFPPQQGTCGAGGFPQPGLPQQEPGGFPPRQGAMPIQQGGGGFPPQMQPQMGMVRPQNPQMMGGSLDQRLASIPEPPPCPFGASNSRPQHTVSSFIQRPPLQGTLEERLAAIPEPPVCHPCDREPSSGGGGGGGNSGFCGGGGFGQRHMKAEDNGLNVKLFPPAAGGWDDGIGGAKIKGFAGQANTDREIVPIKAMQNNITAGSLDGVGGRKIKDLED